ncbi:MAG: hypothetical protein ACPGUD_13730 [Parashewanella sp.]
MSASTELCEQRLRDRVAYHHWCQTPQTNQMTLNGLTYIWLPKSETSWQVTILPKNGHPHSLTSQIMNYLTGLESALKSAMHAERILPVSYSQHHLQHSQQSASSEHISLLKYEAKAEDNTESQSSETEAFAQSNIQALSVTPQGKKTALVIAAINDIANADDLTELRANGGFQMACSFICPLTGEGLSRRNAIQVNLKRPLNRDSDENWITVSRGGLRAALLTPQEHSHFIQVLQELLPTDVRQVTRENTNNKTLATKTFDHAFGLGNHT